jgi:hypothetical protein
MQQYFANFIQDRRSEREGAAGLAAVQDQSEAGYRCADAGGRDPGDSARYDFSTH